MNFWGYFNWMVNKSVTYSDVSSDLNFGWIQTFLFFLHVLFRFLQTVCIYKRTSCLKQNNGQFSQLTFLLLALTCGLSWWTLFIYALGCLDEQHMSPPRYFEPRETTELLIEDLPPPKHKMLRKLDSAPPSPEAEDHYMHWNDPKYIPSFKLIESPWWWLQLFCLYVATSVAIKFEIRWKLYFVVFLLKLIELGQ